MARNFYQTIFVAHRDDRGRLHSPANALNKGIGEIHHVMRAAIVLSHLDETAVGFFRQLIEILRVRTTELVNVLVVIAYGNHTHVLIVGHQRLNQCKFLGTHVLCLVDDQHRFPDFVGFHFALINHFGSPCYHILRVLKIANTAHQVKTVGVEGLDFHIMGRLTNQANQTLFELCCSGARESQHE